MVRTDHRAPKALNVTDQKAGSRHIWTDYEQGSVLGKGTFGIVYEIRHRETGDRRAAKAISKAKLVSEKDVGDVQRELQVLLLVSDNPSVAALVETYEDADHVYFVLELCQGGELFDAIVARGTFNERMAAAHFRTMVQVVYHCHQLGVIHRDIKPENFLLTTHDDSGILKACDFGLSTFFRPGQVFNSIVGSAFYVAPEVLRGRYSHQADMWSLGVVLYILLSGLPPFWGDTEEAIFKMILRADLDLNSQPWRNISDPAKHLLRRLLDRDPALRATPQEILEHPWLREQGVALESPMEPVVLQRMQKFAAMNKLKKQAVLVMARCLSMSELGGLRQLFTSIDTDGSGSISAPELRAALESFGERIPDDELQELVRCADMNGDGAIDWEEFLAATVHLNKLEKDEYLLRAFRHFDKDGSGSITANEIMAGLKEQGISQSEADDLLVQLDDDKNGSISWKEFQTMMLRNDGGSYRQARNQARSFKMERLLSSIPDLPTMHEPLVPATTAGSAAADL